MTSSNSPIVSAGATAPTAPLISLLLLATRAPLSVERAAAAVDACMHRRDALGLGGVYAISEAHGVQLIEGPRDTVMEFLDETHADPQWSTVVVLIEERLLLRWFPAGVTRLRFLSGDLAAPYRAALDALACGDRQRAAVVLTEALVD